MNDFLEPYPRIYTLSSFQKFIWCFAGVILICLGSVIFFLSYAAHSLAQNSVTLHDFLFCFTFPIILVSSGLALIVWAIKFKILFYQDAVEAVGILSSNRLDFQEIAGRKLIQNRNGQTTLIVPTDRSKSVLKISSTLTTDQTFDSWIYSLPDLDAKELEDSKLEVENDSTLGTTQKERQAALKTGQKYAGILNAVAILFSIIGIFYQYPPAILIVAIGLMPLLSIALCVYFPHLYRLDATKNDVHPSLMVPLGFSSFVIFIRGITDIHILDVQTAVLIAICIACALAAPVLLQEVRKDSPAYKKLFLPLLMLLLYGYGVTVEANALLDTSTDYRVFKVMVHGKRVHHGRKSGNTYYLTVDSWSNTGQNDEVTVPSDLFNQVRQGGYVCVGLHPGAFNMPWYAITLCN